MGAAAARSGTSLLAAAGTAATGGSDRLRSDDSGIVGSQSLAIRTSYMWRRFQGFLSDCI
jgi:hypothetical protein